MDVSKAKFKSRKVQESCKYVRDIQTFHYFLLGDQSTQFVGIFKLYVLSNLSNFCPIFLQTFRNLLQVLQPLDYFSHSVICAKITQFSKLNNFETAENFAAKTHWETPHISTNKWWQNESFSTMFRWFFSIVNIAIL